MALDAGSVFAVLGGKFNPAGFTAFDNAMHKSMANAKGMEGALASSAAKGEASLARIGRAGKTLAVDGIAALGVVLDESVKKAINFQSALEMVHTQAGATQGEVDALRGKVLDLAKTLPQGPEELAKGLFHLESIGLRGAKAMDTLKIAGQGAAVGNASLEETATALGSAWLVNIKGAGNLRNVMGLLNATVGAGNMRMGELVQALGTGILPAAKEAGLSIKDVFGALAVFTDEGYQASSAAAQFSTALHFLYNPSAKAAAAFQAIGLKSTSLAADMHKPNGLLVALTDLKTHLDTTFPASGGHDLTIAQQTAALDRFKQGLEASGVSGKKLGTAVDGYKAKLKDMGSAEIAQEQMLGQILPGGRGRILLTLLNQLDRYKMKLGQIGAGVASFGDDVRKTQETDAYKIKTAWSTIEVEMIKLGSHVAPFVATEFSKIAQVIAHLGDSGTVGHIFSTIGHDISGLSVLLPTIETAFHGIVAVAGLTAHEVEAVVNAFGGFSVVGPALLGAYGAIKAFQIGVFVLGPVVKNLAFAFSLLRDAAVGGELLALPGLFAAALGPIGLLTIGVGVLGAAIAILATKESYEAQIAKNVAQAKRDQAQATRDLATAEDAGAHSVLDAQQAHLSLAQARQQLASVTKQYGIHSTQYRQALLQEKQAGLNWTDAHKHMNDELKKLDSQQRNVSIKTSEDYTKALKRVDDAQKAHTDAVKADGAQSIFAQATAHKLAEAQKGLADVAAQLSQTTDRGAISAINYQRALQGIGPIAKKNQGDVSLLTSILNRIPAAKRTKLEADNQDVLAKLGKTVPLLITFGKMQEAATILAHSANAEQALQRVMALLNQLPASKTIDVAINQHTTTSGGGAFQLNKPPPKAPGQHARGARVDKPEYFQAGEDFNREYIIPVEGPWRGRGLELWMHAGHDLGIPGFKKGKAPKKKAKPHRTIPPKRDSLSLPLDTFVNDERNAAQRFKTADTKLGQDDKQIKQLQRRASTVTKGKPAAQARANAQKDLAAARKARQHDASVRDQAKKDLALRKQELKDAQDFADQIKKQEDLAEIARNAMSLADKTDDQKGFDSAQKDRLTALKNLRDLDKKALAHIRAGSPYHRAIEIALGGTLNDIQDAATQINAPETKQTAATELTDAQQAQLDAINMAIALDAVNTPDDLSDDVADTGRLVDFWTSTLAGLQQAGAEDTFITDAANQLKAARDQVTQLTTGGASGGVSPDAQAQINQANQRAQNAEDSARISSRALEVFTGAGDLGLGGPQTVINVNTLHPGDPATLMAIGGAATAGTGYKTSRTSPRVKVGP